MEMLEKLTDYSRVGHGSLFVTQPDPTRPKIFLTRSDPEHVSGFVTRPNPVGIG